MDKSYKTFPRGFLPLILVLTLGMAGFAMIQGTLTLYCSEVFNFSDKQAYLLNSAFVTVIFSIPVLSGVISERFLGYTFSIIVCLILAIAGLYCLCFESVDHFYTGLATFAIGDSIAVACLFITLGRLLPYDNMQKRVAGFTIAYTCMNGGALISLLCAGFIIRNWGYQSAFLLSSIILLFAVFTLLLNLRTLTPADPRCDTVYSPGSRLIGCALIATLIPITMTLFEYAQHNNVILIFVAIVALILIAIMWRTATSAQRQSLKTFLIITAFVTFFWALYALEPSVLTLFIQRNVNRSVFGFSIPSSDFFSLNPLFIILLGSVFSIMWLSFSKLKRIPSLPYKFAIGIGVMGIAFLLLSASTYFANANGLISIGWIIFSYLLLSTAELFISPIGLAMVGPLSPTKYEGVLMGVWLLSNGIGGSLSSYLSEATIYPEQTINPLVTNTLYGFRFCEFGLIALLLATILALFAPRLIKSIKLIGNSI